ncbi:SMP-30/gluconolactonase/LRE family protein [Mucilaginibacter sp.]|uniref:SMP-30/gluconolactonase/LRE family protein n=1 Tax=Mucilaginibacter sp. TaxID=1882438 RepID=UPI00284FAA68|nr:SMP-30/gluconolactonase/LRE family protein [Mucilaginibacter sp.]MDR3696635.1 SMP-30/gluconolactonase/LRE family protein [Mucilaginibacter sp.]
MQAEIILPHQCLLGEGPVWDIKRGVICWIDILDGEIHEYSPESKKHKTIPVNQMVGAAVICRDGNFLAALKNGFGFVNRETGEVNMLANPESHIPGNRFNDGKCGPDGRFWAGTMSHTDEPGKGSFYAFDTDHSVSKKISNVSISNGMAWSADHKTFYYIDTPTFTVAAYDFDKNTAEISNKRVVINIPKEDGSPDGMTIDSEGMLWIAHWDGWQITRWNPDTGKKLLSIPLPAARITSCAFGGDDMDDLYITSARTGLTKDQLTEQPLAGSLFIIKNIGYKGLQGFEFGKQ